MARFAMVIDGQEGPVFDQIALLGARPGVAGKMPAEFSRNGKRVAYVGKRGGEEIAVIDGKEDTPYMQILGAWTPGAHAGGTPVVAANWLAEATRTQASTGGAGGGYGYQWWTRDDGTFEGRGIYGQTLHVDRARRLVIVINSAAAQPTDRAAGQARQAFIAAIETAVDAEPSRP